MLRAEIQRRGLDQTQAAEAIGVSLSRLREWLESNPPRPTRDACEAIARFVGRPPAEVRRLAGRSESSVMLPARAARPEVIAFCSRLSSELAGRGLTHADASAAIGVHPRTVANWFGPHPRRPSPQICARLASFLGIGADEVRSWAGYPPDRLDEYLPPEPTPGRSPVPHAEADSFPPSPPSRDLIRLEVPQPNRVTIRLAIIQAAAAFLANRPEVSADEVEALAARWEAWVLDGGNRGLKPS